eukprot:GHVR01156145.1.p1 GENE.GHVR01156145.1~~GHVR01156145.1.p1  ORF type:complete len:157 (-),score=12.35 GHVR01156145.1:18-488(-)
MTQQSYVKRLSSQLLLNKRSNLSTRGISLNANKRHEATTTTPPIKLLGKMITTKELIVDQVPSAHPVLHYNSKLNAAQKLLVYRQTSLTKWAYALECCDDLDIPKLDSNTRGTSRLAKGAEWSETDRDHRSPPFASPRQQEDTLPHAIPHLRIGIC